MLLKFVFKLSLLFILVFTPFTFLFADDGDMIPDPDTAVPFDGGVVSLLAAGVGYGIRMIYKSKQNISTDPVVPK